jgi:diguanylate cyclase (GGDEF)-like protein
MELTPMYNVLVVDDAKDSILILNHDLSAAGYRVNSAYSGEQALEILSSEKIDLILLDMYMPGMSGMEALQQLKANAATANIPVIMLSGADGEDDIVNALESGADDYVTKPYIAKVLLARMRTSLRLMEKTRQLKLLACTDHLTKINNRRRFYDLAARAVSQSKRNDEQLVVAMFDLDMFKQVNDNHGHETGDRLLVSFAQLLSKCFRDYDVLGRVGGEEFAVCMPNISIDDASRACERLRCQLEKQQLSIGTTSPGFVSATVSIGIACATTQGFDLTDLLRSADQALYSAKEKGRNQVVVDQQSAARSSAKSRTNTSNDSSRIDGIDVAFGIRNVLGDKDIYNEILQMFYQDHHQDHDKLANALASNDLVKAKLLAHTLKGVASSVGAMDLFEKAKLLDKALSEGDSDSYEDLLDELSTALCTVMQGIENNAG